MVKTNLGVEGEDGVLVLLVGQRELLEQLDALADRLDL